MTVGLAVRATEYPRYKQRGAPDGFAWPPAPAPGSRPEAALTGCPFSHRRLTIVVCRQRTSQKAVTRTERNAGLSGLRRRPRLQQPRRSALPMALVLGTFRLGSWRLPDPDTDWHESRRSESPHGLTACSDFRTSSCHCMCPCLALLFLSYLRILRNLGFIRRSNYWAPSVASLPRLSRPDWVARRALRAIRRPKSVSIRWDTCPPVTTAFEGLPRTGGPRRSRRRGRGKRGG